MGFADGQHIGTTVGPGDPTITDLLSILADDVKNACVSDGGGFDAVQNILSIMRQLQLFGLDAKADELNGFTWSGQATRSESGDDREGVVRSYAVQRAVSRPGGQLVSRERAYPGVREIGAGSYRAFGATGCPDSRWRTAHARS